MDKLHKRILQVIPIGSERPRPRREIEQMLGMSKRSVERGPACLNRLTMTDGSVHHQNHIPSQKKTKMKFMIAG